MALGTDKVVMYPSFDGSTAAFTKNTQSQAVGSVTNTDAQATQTKITANKVVVAPAAKGGTKDAPVTTHAG